MSLKEKLPLDGIRCEAEDDKNALTPSKISKKEVKMKILICYDDSDAADEALKVSIQHAKVFDAKLYIITSLIGGDKDSVDDNIQAESRLEHAKKIAEKEGIPCETHLLVRGLSSGRDIVRFADENQIDEIVIGIKKTSKVGKLVFGSTAQHVILEAGCPVVTIR